MTRCSWTPVLLCGNIGAVTLLELGYTGPLHKPSELHSATSWETTRDSRRMS